MSIFKEKSTFRKLTQKITDVIVGNPEVDDKFMDELEEALVVSDIGIDTTEHIMEKLREKINERYIKDPAEIKEVLCSIIAEIVDKGERNKLCQDDPLIVLMIGINGGGKTTSIAKIANRCKADGRSDRKSVV